MEYLRLLDTRLFYWTMLHFIIYNDLVGIQVMGVDPTFDVPMVNVTVIEGQTAILPCSINNLGRKTVAWINPYNIPLSYDDRLLVDDRRVSLSRPHTKDWNIQIAEVTHEDQGQYLCTIDTTPSIRKTVVLAVHDVNVPPEITMPTTRIAQMRGRDTIVECIIMASPMAVTYWMKDGQKILSQTGKYHIQPYDEGENTIALSLQIYDLQPEDFGEYVCTASNGLGEDSKSMILYEYGQSKPKPTKPSTPQEDKDMGIPPEITIPTDRIGQMRGQDTILECIITASPLAFTYWMKDRQEIPSQTGKYQIQPYDEGDHTITLTLQIYDVQPDDFGEYMCIASNNLGLDIKSIMLYEYGKSQTKPTMPSTQQKDKDIGKYSKSQAKPTMPSTAQQKKDIGIPPGITMPTSRIGQMRGRDTIVECIIMASPLEVTYWMKDGQKILNQTGKFHIQPYDEGDHTITLTLQIYDVQPEDFGEYTCTASNGLGEDSKSMILYEYRQSQPKTTTPSPPQEIPPVITIPTSHIGQRRGRDTMLECIIMASPMEVIYWMKDGQIILSQTGKYQIQPYDEGDNTITLTLQIYDVQSEDFGEYTCTASNGLGEDSKSMILYEYRPKTTTPSPPQEIPPEITIPTSHIGQRRGRDTILECIIMASPMGVTYWMKDGQKILSQTGKYQIQPYDEGDHTVALTLQIYDVQPEDFGEYTCTSLNGLGEDSKSMILYEYTSKQSKPKPTKPSTPQGDEDYLSILKGSGSPILRISYLVVALSSLLWTL